MNYSERAARVRHHETQLKIVAGAESWAEPTQRILGETWRSGGGCVAHSTTRATLVRRILDYNYGGFGMVARNGVGID